MDQVYTTPIAKVTGCRRAILFAASLMWQSAFAQPANDLVCNAQAVMCGITINGTTAGATQTGTYENSTCGVTQSMAGVWYMIAGNGQTMTASLCITSGWDSRISVYFGNCTFLFCIGGNDQSSPACSGDPASFTWATATGNTYFIKVHGSSTNSVFSLNISCGLPNDLVCNAQAVACGSTTTGTTVGATQTGTYENSTCDLTQTRPGVWYSVEGNGETITASLCNSSDWWSRISVYSGTCTDLVCAEGVYSSADCQPGVSKAWPTTNGVTYFILVHGLYIDSNFSLSVTCVPTPTNDMACDAIALSCNSTTVGTTHGASMWGAGESSDCGVDQGRPGVWYTILGNGQTMLASLCGSPGWNSRISVYQTSCTNLLNPTYSYCLGGNDQNGPGCNGDPASFSWVSFNGTTYLIKVHGTFNESNFSLSVNCIVNDFICDAQAISCGSTTTGTTVGATGFNQGEGSCGVTQTRGAVWYSIVGNGQLMTAALCGTAGWNSKIDVYSGTCAIPICMGGNDQNGPACSGDPASFTWPSTNGVTYFIKVHGVTNDSNFSLSVSCFTAVANDLVCNAQAVSCGSTTTGTTMAATSTGEGGPCGPTHPRPTVWYSIVGNDQLMTASLCGTVAWDSRISVFSDNCTSLTCIGGNDQNGPACSGDPASFSWYTTSGVTYFIKVSGASTESNFDLSVSCIPPAANDFVCNAQAVSCGSTTAGTTIGATQAGTGETWCGVSQIRAGVWYSIVGNGHPMTASLCGTAGWDSRISIYSGTCAPLTCIGGNDQNGSACSGDPASFTWASTSGVTYFIKVHGTNTNSAFSLNVSCVLNDLVCNAQTVGCGSTVAGTTVGATNTGTVENATCGVTQTSAGVWYSMVGNGQVITANLCGAAGWDSRISVYSGTCDGLICLGGNDDNGPVCSGIPASFTWLSTNGVPYFIKIHGTSSTSAFSLIVICGPEMCSTAQQVNVAADITACTPTNVVSGNSQDGPAGICGVAPPHDDVWYKFTAPSSGNKLVITTAAISNNDWVMELWDGCNGGVVVCTDDISGSYMPRIELCPGEYTLGSTYNIRLWTTVVGGFGGISTLCVYESPCVNLDHTINNGQPTGGTNFNSFTDAIHWLNNTCICGPITFLVQAGQTFMENPPALTATGTADHPITFLRTGTGTNPLIQPTGTAGTSDAAIDILGGDHITFDGIDIDASTVTTVEYGYRVRNGSTIDGASHNTIRNCSVTLNRINTNSTGIICSSSSTGEGVPPSATEGATSNNLIENVEVTNCRWGITVVSEGSMFPGQNNKIRNCVVGAAYAGTPSGDIGGGFGSASGINFWVQSDGQISGNTVQNIASFDANRGIYIFESQGITEIFNNRIHGIRNLSSINIYPQRGMELYASGFAASFRVVNNLISNITLSFTGMPAAARALIGIDANGHNVNYEIDHNNVSLDGSGSPNVTSACLVFSCTSCLNVARNNVLANLTGPQSDAAKHFVIQSSSTSSFGWPGSISDHNNLFILEQMNGFIARSGSIDHPTLSSWTSALGQDMNSMSANPLFIDPDIDPHATNSILQGAGMPGVIPWATTDLDGVDRADPPTIGAHEIATPAFIAVNVRAILDGPYNAGTGLMGDNLRAFAHIPTAHPYTAVPFNHPAGETVDASVLAVTGNNAIVDWVLLELRDQASASTVIGRRAALIQRDGDIVDLDGVSPVNFLNLALGDYYVAVRHRNHLAVMTADPVTLSTTLSSIDLGSSATVCYGTNARKSVTGAFPAEVLWTGDVNFNGQVQYSGSGNDRDPVLVRIGGTVATNTVQGYYPEDVNLDGVVKYTGSQNDRDPILENIGGTVPTLKRLEQLP